MPHWREVIGHGGLGEAQAHLEGMTPLPGWGSGYVLKAVGSGIGSCGSVFNYQLTYCSHNMEAGLEGLGLLETWEVPEDHVVPDVPVECGIHLQHSCCCPLKRWDQLAHWQCASSPAQSTSKLLARMAPPRWRYASRGVRLCPRTMAMYLGGRNITLRVWISSVPTSFAANGLTIWSNGSALRRASKFTSMGTWSAAPFETWRKAISGHSTVVQLWPNMSPSNAITILSHWVGGTETACLVGWCISTIQPTTLGSIPAASMMYACRVDDPYANKWVVKASGMLVATIVNWDMMSPYTPPQGPLAALL